MSVARGSLVLYHANYPIDVLVRLGSGSYWSHVAVAQGDGSAICAWAGGGGMASGVIDNFADHYADRQGISQAIAFAGDVEKLIVLMRGELGKPYDCVGLLANPLQNVLRIKMGGGPPSRFTCSSLVAWATSQLGIVWPKPLRAVTPQDVFNRFAGT